MANIIFDLDGTLWSTISTAVKAWNEALDFQNLSAYHITDEQMAAHVGKPRNEILVELLPMLSSEQMSQMTRDSGSLSFQRISESGGIIYPDVMSTLEQLKSDGHKMFIVSNCVVGYIDLFLNQTNSHAYFLDQECWGSLFQEKSENIKLLMKRNRINEAYYVGDTDGDYTASKKAGTTFIYSSYGFGYVKYADKIEINCFKDLVSIF
jgi:phosphoglycolate phosphatase